MMKGIITIGVITFLTVLASAEAKDLRKIWEADDGVMGNLMRLSRQENVYPCPGDSWDIVACRCPGGSWGPWSALPWTEDPCTPKERPGTCECSDGSRVDMIEFVNNFVPMHYPPV